MISPVSSWIEVVGGVVAVVEADAVALDCDQHANNMVLVRYETHHNINHSDASPEIRVWIDLVNKRMLTPVANHKCETQ